ncbi:CdaR family transcriptional regulator [Brevibacillus sp. TJ4]|uniref:CdaR family transcriptional regulator n=1 Tax=Brevibacillus sp. TJ4 TaxID=3234853 RepID=UPI003BA3BCB1
MKLNKTLADTIVKRTREVTQLNINVMDKNGMIISSSDASRINTFHAAALHVVASGQDFLLSPQESRKWTGTRPGINMPICFQNEIVGVIGISGSPREVVPFGKAVRMMTEMMLQQAYLTEQMAMAERSLNFLIQDIISGSLNDAPDVIRSRAELLGIQFRGPRSIILVQFADVAEGADGQSHRYLQQKMASCFSHPEQVFLSAIKHNLWIILTDLSGIGGHDESKRYLYASAEKLRNLLTPVVGCDLLITMGNGYEDVRELELSFREAQKTLDVLERFPEKGRICHIEDAAIEVLLLETPAASRELVIQETIGPLLKHSELMQTLQTLFSSDLNLSLAAQRLNLHRNTLLYRLDRIEDILGRNPRNFADAVRIQLALELYRMQKLDKSYKK